MRRHSNNRQISAFANGQDLSLALPSGHQGNVVAGDRKNQTARPRYATPVGNDTNSAPQTYHVQTTQRLDRLSAFAHRR